VISDRPGVGQNLQDQIDFLELNGMSTPSAAGTVSDPSKAAENLQRYLADATGPYSSAGGYLSFEKLPSAFRANFSARTAFLLANQPADDQPELEYIAFGFPTGEPSMPTIGAIGPTLLAPFSRGNVTNFSATMADTRSSTWAGSPTQRTLSSPWRPSSARGRRGHPRR
jgi:choline dehydrogenase